MCEANKFTVPCEVAAKKIVPAIRAAIAIVLVREFGLTTYRAAKLLSLTPAAVSNYLLGRRGGEVVDIILGDSELRSHVYSIAEKVVSGSDGIEVVGDVCVICRKVREKLASTTCLEAA